TPRAWTTRAPRWRPGPGSGSCSASAWRWGRTSSAATPSARRIEAVMLDHSEVLHVARLARLRLTDEEVERMSSELSAVLDHIENISQLDLDGVEPTSHVIELENVLREDVPRPSWPRETILEPAPDTGDGGFRVP